jgi:arylsulfatase A-like enzyme
MIAPWIRRNGHKTEDNWVIVLIMLNTLLQKNWPWLVAAGLIVLWLLSTSIKYEPPIVDARPTGGEAELLRLAEREDLNVLFVLVDTLRADRLGSYGYERDTNPAIGAFTSKGVRFARHLSQSSWTKASMASLWTGLYPTATGVTRYDHILHEDAITAAERFREAGFRTIGLWSNGWVDPTFGFEQGFDVYTRPARRRLNPAVRSRNPTISDMGTDEDLVAAAIEFLRVSGHDQQFFLYLHLMDLHEFRYDEQSALFGGTHSDMYDNSIRWMDGTLEVLFGHLARFGLAENTLVVIGSDHGEAFRERGLEGHARALYRETTEVPFLISFPFKLESGIVVSSRSRNVDIWPTILELVGIDPLEDVDGRSLMPEIMAALRGKTLPDSADMGISFLDETWGQQKASESRFRIGVTEGSYRYLRSPARADDAEPFEELFDAAQDPDELEDVASKHPEIVDRLREVAEAQLEITPVWGEVPTRALGELELNQLRALGYAIP